MRDFLMVPPPLRPLFPVQQSRDKGDSVYQDE